MRGRGRRGALTQHAAVEVVGEHALAHSNQQPEGVLLRGVEQQHGGQDVHGLRATGGVTERTTWASDMKRTCPNERPTTQHQGAHPHAWRWDDCVSVSVVSRHLSSLHGQPAVSVPTVASPMACPPSRSPWCPAPWLARCLGPLPWSPRGRPTISVPWAVQDLLWCPQAQTELPVPEFPSHRHTLQL